ncbi:MAG: carboxypeptidase-like regulatory domain-containing protein [Candidatus Kapaibacterium sp.]
MKILILALIIVPILLFAGDPVPGIGITVEQSPNGVAYTGIRNNNGEYVFSDMKEGDYIIKIKSKDKEVIIGKNKDDKISVSSIKKNNSKPYRTYLKLARNASPSINKTIRKNPLTTKDNEHDLSKADSKRSQNESIYTKDNDCDGEVEITTLGKSRLKIKITCGK